MDVERSHRFRMLVILGSLLALLIVPALASAEEYASASRSPWSGWWWPKGGNYRHLYDAGGPLQKYDAYVYAQSGYNPGTQSAEYRQSFANGTPESWAGHCHAWSAASLLTYEPAGNFYRGQTYFSSDDTKALVTKLYDNPVVGYSWGTRYGWNATQSTAAAYRDIAPVWFDYLMRYYVGYRKYPIIMDIEPDKPVWNFPAFAYRRYTTPFAGGESVRMQVWFSSPVLGANGTKPFMQDYTYVLRNGQLGEWTGTSTTKHPDFAWLPTGKGRISIDLRESVVEQIVGRDV